MKKFVALMLGFLLFLVVSVPAETKTEIKPPGLEIQIMDFEHQFNFQTLEVAVFEYRQPATLLQMEIECNEANFSYESKILLPEIQLKTYQHTSSYLNVFRLCSNGNSQIALETKEEYILKPPLLELPKWLMNRK
jgi:hypothetical protein